MLLKEKNVYPLQRKLASNVTLIFHTSNYYHLTYLVATTKKSELNAIEIVERKMLI
jgi:hypothetical protein